MGNFTRSFEELGAISKRREATNWLVVREGERTERYLPFRYGRQERSPKADTEIKGLKYLSLVSTIFS